MAQRRGTQVSNFDNVALRVSEKLVKQSHDPVKVTKSIFKFLLFKTKALTVLPCIQKQQVKSLKAAKSFERMLRFIIILTTALNMSLSLIDLAIPSPESNSVQTEKGV